MKKASSKAKLLSGPDSRNARRPRTQLEMNNEHNSITGQSSTNQKPKSPTKIGKFVKPREDSPESVKNTGTLVSKQQEQRTDSDGGGASCQTEEKKVNVRKLLMKDLLPAVDEDQDQKDFEFDDFPLRTGN